MKERVGDGILIIISMTVGDHRAVNGEREITSSDADDDIRAK